MAKHLVMDQSGHTTIEFDKLDPLALAEAEKRFKELTGEGWRAAERRGEGKSELIRAFDPNAEETLFIRPLVGG